jgi:ABC-type multidrug transport system, ATPase and permease components
MARGGTVVSIGTLVAFTTLQTRLLFPIGSLLNVQADLQTSTALFDRVFEYLDLPVEIEEPENPVPFDPARAAGEVEFRNVGFHYDEPAAPPCATSTSSRPRAAAWRSWARPGPARPRSAI